MSRLGAFCGSPLGAFIGSPLAARGSDICGWAYPGTACFATGVSIALSGISNAGCECFKIFTPSPTNSAYVEVRTFSVNGTYSPLAMSYLAHPFPPPAFNNCNAIFSATTNLDDYATLYYHGLSPACSAGSPTKMDLASFDIVAQFTITPGANWRFAGLNVSVSTVDSWFGSFRNFKIFKWVAADVCNKLTLSLPNQLSGCPNNQTEMAHSGYADFNFTIP